MKHPLTCPVAAHAVQAAWLACAANILSSCSQRTHSGARERRGRPAAALLRRDRAEAPVDTRAFCSRPSPSRNFGKARSGPWRDEGGASRRSRVTPRRWGSWPSSAALWCSRKRLSKLAGVLAVPVPPAAATAANPLLPSLLLLLPNVSCRAPRAAAPQGVQDRPRHAQRCLPR